MERRSVTCNTTGNTEVRRHSQQEIELSRKLNGDGQNT